MKDFLKENITLVAAIALPALLALVFAVSTLFVNASVENPKHDFLVITDYYEGNTGHRFEIVDQKFKLSYTAPRKDQNGYTPEYNGKPRLWRVHVPDMNVEEIALPAISDKNRDETLSVPALADLKMQNLMPGPDGYSYVDSYARGDNLMTEIFSGGSGRDRMPGIFKNGRMISFSIPDGNTYYSGYNSRFLGWIVNEGQAQ